MLTAAKYKCDSNLRMNSLEFIYNLYIFERERGINIFACKKNHDGVEKYIMYVYCKDYNGLTVV